MRLVRMQVQLTREQLARLRRRAHERGMSVAALLREAVDVAVLAPADARRDRALRAVGAYASGHSDTSIDHDRAFADAARS